MQGYNMGIIEKSSPIKILADAGVLSVGVADPAYWSRVTPTNPPGFPAFTNRLIVYCGREIKENNKTIADEWLYVQAIGRAAREKTLGIYSYSELQWENWLGFQSMRNNVTPYYAFNGVEILHIDSPIERSKFFQSANWLKGEEVEKFIDWLLTCDLNLLWRIESLLSSYEMENFKNLDIFRVLCSEEVFGRKRARDVFHLWAAECAGIDYFLTVDFKFLRIFEDKCAQNKVSTRCKVISPSALIKRLNISTDDIDMPTPGKCYTMNGVEYGE